MVVAKRVFGLFLLAFGLAMAIAALADRNWVDQKQMKDSYGTYRLGLQEVSEGGRGKQWLCKEWMQYA